MIKPLAQYPAANDWQIKDVNIGLPVSKALALKLYGMLTVAIVLEIVILVVLNN